MMNIMHGSCQTIAYKYYILDSLYATFDNARYFNKKHK